MKKHCSQNKACTCVSPLPKTFGLLLLAGLLFTGCQQERDIRDYYFPVRTLTKGLVYEYEPIAGPDTFPIYWYLLGLDQDTALQLATTTYGPDFSPSTLIREEILNDGVVAREVRLYETDTIGHSKESVAEIVAGNVFPFFLPAGTPPAYVYQIRHRPGGGVVYTITYNRQYDRDTTVVLQGEKVSALVFSITGETDVFDPEQGSLTPKFSGYEIYAKQIGLVETYRNFDGVIFHNRLRDRISMQSLQERAQAAY